MIVFKETDPQQALAARSVKTLVLTGLVRHACVKTKCMDTLESGYGVLLVADGYSSFSKQAELPALPYGSGVGHTE
jgi:isochorismate hydrolase